MAFGFASLSCFIFISFLFGVHFFIFIFYLFLSSPLIFILGLLPSLHFLFYLSGMGKKFAESKVCTYYKNNQSQFKNYESYYYRTLTQSMQLLVLVNTPFKDAKRCGAAQVQSSHLCVVCLPWLPSLRLYLSTSYWYAQF